MKSQCLAYFSLLLLLAGCQPAVPDLGEEALQNVQALCEQFPERIAGHSSQAAATWICNQLPSTARRLPFTPAKSTLTLTNVYWESTEKPEILLISHYDTKQGIPNFVGANDGGSTTGLLIALAKYFSQHPPKGGIACAFVDGEECIHRYGPNDGLLGSLALAEQMRTCPPKAVIVLDMLGDRELQIQLADTGDAALNRLVREAAANVGVVTQTAYGLIDDHLPFRFAGIPATTLIDFNYGPDNCWWHTAEDTIDKLSAQSLNTVGKLVLKLVQLLENNK